MQVATMLVAKVLVTSMFMVSILTDAFASEVNKEENWIPRVSGF